MLCGILKMKKIMNKQFDYFIKNIQLFYEIQDIAIDYGQKPDVKISISENVESEFWNTNNDIHLNDIVWKEWKGKKIPFLFEKDSEKNIISYENGKATINYDIVASTFYFLSGWNEYVSSSKDEFGRIKYEDSIIKRLGIAVTPVVNYYFDILNEAIKKIYNKDIKKNLWKNNNFAVSLTHDIDTCKSCWLEGSFSELKKRRLLSVPKLILSRFLDTDDWFNFDKIVEIEKRYGAISSFYFLPQKGKVGNWKNADYNIKSKNIQKTITTLKNSGNEVGVHGSFGTHSDSNKFKTDINRVNSQPIIGNRFHFLMFDPKKTVSVLEECGIKYDTTLGFAEQIGFRRGTCYPFYLWNFENDEMSSVLEIPLIVMDGTLSNKKYMGISKEESLSKVSELIDEIKKFNGVFTLLWHNTYFSDYKYTGWRDVYIKILDYCKENKGFLTGGGEIYEKIRRNEK